MHPIRKVLIEAHARERMSERGATEEEVAATVAQGEMFQAKFGRVGFRRNFNYDGLWRERLYATKQVEVLAVEENDQWVAITVIVKFF
ncbi:MAG: DUF4258 domain-containing protein [Methylocystis sp.]